MIKNSSHTDYLFFFLSLFLSQFRRQQSQVSYDATCPGGYWDLTAWFFFLFLDSTLPPSHLWINKDADGLLSRSHLPMLLIDSSTSHPEMSSSLATTQDWGEEEGVKEVEPFCLSETCLKSDASPLSQPGHEAFLISVPNAKYLAPGNKKLEREGVERSKVLCWSVCLPQWEGLE